MNFKFQRLQFWLLEVLCLVAFFRVLLFVSNPSFLLKPFFVPFAPVSEDPKSVGHGSPDTAGARLPRHGTSGYCFLARWPLFVLCPL